MDEILDVLQDDFKGYGSMRRYLLKRVPKWGNNHPAADALAKRIADYCCHKMHTFTDPRGGPVQAALFTLMYRLSMGKATGATPDGRQAGQPTSENTSPYPGACKNGITAMLKSVSKLPLDRINSGALNVRMQPKLAAGEEGLTRLSSLLRTYFEMGGLQVQLSLADTEELRDAQIHPEHHRDLMVRITGYSAAFVDMSKPAQDEIIRRQEMGY